MGKTSAVSIMLEPRVSEMECSAIRIRIHEDNYAYEEHRQTRRLQEGYASQEGLTIPVLLRFNMGRFFSNWGCAGNAEREGCR
jgi:hypothetical protein